MFVFVFLLGIPELKTNFSPLLKAYDYLKIYSVFKNNFEFFVYHFFTVFISEK